MSRITCKRISIIFVVLAIIMLFRGGITVRDADSRKNLKETVNDTIEKLDDKGGELEELEEELDGYGININAKKVLRKIKGTVRILSDASISPSELAFIAPGLFSISNELEKLEGYSEVGGYLGVDIDELVSGIRSFKGYLIFIIILFWGTMLLGILTLVNHFREKRFRGISFMIICFVWFALFAGISATANMYVDMYMLSYGDEGFFKLTFSPFLGFLFALVAMIFWIKFNRAPVEPEKSLNTQEFGSKDAGSVKICPNCAQKTNAESAFCKNCGADLRNITQLDKTANICPGCGQPVGEGASFCKNCGTKIDSGMQIDNIETIASEDEQKNASVPEAVDSQQNV